jgi:hypothetical protein
MALIVYGWRKPTLELALVEGGSLLPNTKYYVCGCMKFTPATYTSVGSPISDIYEITTTTTAKSIQITHKTYRDISSFADGGGGVTLVTCSRHCLMTNDVIKISSGSYTGSWTVTRIGYHTFTIPTAYIDNIPVQCYSDSQNYGRPTDAYFQSGYAASVYHFVSYYVNTLHPFIDGVNWVAYQAWTSASYQTYNNTNPTIIISQPAENFWNGNPCLKVRGLCTGFFKSVCDDYGTILVYFTSLVTFQQIYDEIQASGFIYNCMYNYSPNNHFWLVGTLLGRGAGALNGLGTNISIINGEMFNPDNAELINLINCMINTVPRTSQNTFMGRADDCIYFNNAISVSSRGLFSGSGTLFQACPYPSNSWYYCDIPNQTLINLSTGQSRSYGIVQNKIFKPPINTAMMQVAYNSVKYINTQLYSLNHMMYNEAAGTQPDIYMMENCYIKQAGHSDYSWHYRFYAYPAGRVYQNIIKFLNINTDDLNNVKKCVSNIAINIIASFYRRVIFYVKDIYGIPVQNIDIHIIDGTYNIYTGFTDINGYCYIDCLEQKTQYNDLRIPSSVHDKNYDTFFRDFTITISKNGYAAQIMKMYNLYQPGIYDTVFNLFLNESSNLEDPELVDIEIIDCSSLVSNDGSIEIEATGNQILAYAIEKL